MTQIKVSGPSEHLCMGKTKGEGCLFVGAQTIRGGASRLYSWLNGPGKLSFEKSKAFLLLQN